GRVLAVGTSLDFAPGRYALGGRGSLLVDRLGLLGRHPRPPCRHRWTVRRLGSIPVHFRILWRWHRRVHRAAFFRSLQRLNPIVLSKASVDQHFARSGLVSPSPARPSGEPGLRRCRWSPRPLPQSPGCSWPWRTGSCTPGGSRHQPSSSRSPSGLLASTAPCPGPRASFWPPTPATAPEPP